MNIFNTDFVALQEYAKENKITTKDLPKEIATALLKIKLNPSFFPHVIAFLANIKPQRDGELYSATKTIEAIPSAITVEGLPVERKEIMALLGVLYYYSFSSLSKIAQSKGQYNAAVPMMLLSQRMYNNVKYDDWDKSDPFMKAFLTKDLKDVLEVEFPELSEEDYELARVNSVTDGAGIRCEFSSYKCNATGIENIQKMPRLMKHMYLKTWIFANPNSRMILDPKLWDNDIVDVKVPTKQEKPKKDRTWDNSDLPF